MTLTALGLAVSLISPAPAQAPTWNADVRGLDPVDVAGIEATGVDGRIFAVIPCTLQGRDLGRIECRDANSGDLLWGVDQPGLDRVWGVTHQGDGSSFVMLSTERADPGAPMRAWLRRFSAGTGLQTQRVDLGAGPIPGLTTGSLSLATDDAHESVFVDRWTLDEVYTYRFEIEGLDLAWRSSVHFGSDMYWGSVQVSPDGRRVVTAGNALELNDATDNDAVWACFDGESGELLWSHRAFGYQDGYVAAHAVSASAPENGARHPQYRVHVVHVDEERVLETRGGLGDLKHVVPVEQVFSPMKVDAQRNRLLYRSGFKGPLLARCTSTGQLLGALEVEAQSFELDAGSDRLVVTGRVQGSGDPATPAPSRVEVWDLKTDTLVWGQTYTEALAAAQVSLFLVSSQAGPPGILLATRDSSNARRGSLRARILEPEGGDVSGAWQLDPLLTTAAPVARIQPVSADGSIAVIGLSQLDEYPQDNVPLFLSQAYRQRVTRLRPADGSVLGSFDLELGGGPPVLAFSPTGRRLLSASEFEKVWPSVPPVAVDYDVTRGRKIWTRPLDALADRSIRNLRLDAPDRAAVLWEALAAPGSSSFSSRRIGLSLLDGGTGAPRVEGLIEWPVEAGTELAPKLAEVVGPVHVPAHDALVVAAQDPSDEDRVLIVALSATDGTLLWSRAEDLAELLGGAAIGPIALGVDAHSGSVILAGGVSPPSLAYYESVPFLAAYAGDTGTPRFHSSADPLPGLETYTLSSNSIHLACSGGGEAYVVLDYSPWGPLPTTLVTSFSTSDGAVQWSRATPGEGRLLSESLHLDPSGTSLALVAREWEESSPYVPYRGTLSWFDATDGEPLSAVTSGPFDHTRWIDGAFTERGFVVGGGRLRGLGLLPLGRVLHFQQP